MSTDVLLSANGVTKAFLVEGRREVVLDSISVEVPRFSLFSFFGPNGCGKSTLLSILAGLINPDAGTVSREVGGRDTGFVFQDYSRSLMPWRTCLENIALPLEAQNRGKREAHETAMRLLSTLEISLPVSNYPYQMSGGQKQIACIARALIRNPALLFLDEPFASLDFETRRALRRTIQDIHAKAQVTTVLVSHEIEDAVTLADFVVLLSRRPARVVHIFPIEFARPRDREVIGSKSFISLREHILHVAERECNI